MWNRIKEWWKAEGDLAQLQGVSDRMLDDMGLGRDGLRSRVMGGTVPQDGSFSATASPAALAIPCRC